jgi:RNA polymerase sigma-70 factor (ECF subfamily)
MANSLSNRVPPATGAISAGPEATTCVSFGDFYNEHFAFVCRNARRLAPFESVVDDLAQEVFVVALRRFGEFGNGAPPRAWLFGILRNVLHKHRHAKHRRNIRDSVDPDALPDDLSQMPAERVQAFELLSKLLSTLDDAKREVFVLAELERMTAQEIAVATGASVSTVTARLRDARSALQIALRRHRARTEREEP